MRILRYIITATLALCVMPVMAWQLAPEAETLDTWEFSLDSTRWQTVAVPHTYNAVDGHSEHYYRGHAWYRRTISLTTQDLTRRLALFFEAVGQQCTVYVNGKAAVRHRGGYTPFYAKLDGLVHTGANTVTVACDNTLDMTLAPISADFNKNGGLHYPVHLLRFPRVAFSPKGTGPYRLHVATPQVSRDKALARCTVCIDNGTTRRQTVTVAYTLSDHEGRAVATGKRRVTLQPDTDATVTADFTLRHPHLWDGLDDPYLYTLRVSLADSKGHALDQASTTVGFRHYEMTRDRGFFLNGRSYPLRGVDVHQDLEGKGSAMTEADFRRDYATIHELGCNFLRLAHYPHRDYVYRLCDSLGIVVQTEIPWVADCAANVSTQYFEDLHGEMREMITSLYNHPSIICWGMWNEVGHPKAEQGAPDFQRAADETARLYRLAKSLDHGRLVGVTDCTLFESQPYRTLTADYFSENRYNGWYYDTSDFSAFTRDMQLVHQRMGICNVGEYGAGSNPWCHTYQTLDAMTNKPTHYEEYANLMHESYVRQIRHMPFLNFTAVWVLFDFAVASRQEGYLDSADGITFTDNPARKYINDKGLITRDRQTRKDAFYLYKSLWNHRETTVYITSRRRDVVPRGVQLPVKVYSNAPSLELRLDGQLVQTLATPTDETGVVWQFQPLTLEPGNHVINVTGGGQTDEATFTAR